MTIPFTGNEIRKVIPKMKPNKSPGCDEIPVELIEYAPDRIHQQIAKIYNNIAETGEIPKEVTYDILKPLQKPNKAKYLKPTQVHHRETVRLHSNLPTTFTKR